MIRPFNKQYIQQTIFSTIWTKTKFYFLANTAFLIFLLPLCTKAQFELKKKSELYLLCFQKDVFFSITKAKMRGIGRGVFKKLVITSRESSVC